MTASEQDRLGLGLVRQPRTVIFGPGQRNQLGYLAAGLARSVLVVTDSEVAVPRFVPHYSNDYLHLSFDDRTRPREGFRVAEEGDIEQALQIIFRRLRVGEDMVGAGLQGRIVVHRQGEPGVGGGVFVGAVDAGLVGQGRQLGESGPHHFRRALE